MVMRLEQGNVSEALNIVPGTQCVLDYSEPQKWRKLWDFFEAMNFPKFHIVTKHLTIRKEHLWPVTPSTTWPTVKSVAS